MMSASCMPNIRLTTSDKHTNQIPARRSHVHNGLRETHQVSFLSDTGNHPLLASQLIWHTSVHLSLRLRTPEQPHPHPTGTNTNTSCYALSYAHGRDKSITHVYQCTNYMSVCVCAPPSLRGAALSTCLHWCCIIHGVKCVTYLSSMSMQIYTHIDILCMYVHRRHTVFNASSCSHIY